MTGGGLGIWQAGWVADTGAGRVVGCQGFVGAGGYRSGGFREDSSDETGMRQCDPAS